jgi:hypothetical protein
MLVGVCFYKPSLLPPAESRRGGTRLHKRSDLCLVAWAFWATNTSKLARSTESLSLQVLESVSTTAGWTQATRRPLCFPDVKADLHPCLKENLLCLYDDRTYMNGTVPGGRPH